MNYQQDKCIINSLKIELYKLLITRKKQFLYAYLCKFFIIKF